MKLSDQSVDEMRSFAIMDNGNDDGECVNAGITPCDSVPREYIKLKCTIASIYSCSHLHIIYVRAENKWRAVKAVMIRNWKQNHY